MAVHSIDSPSGFAKECAARRGYGHGQTSKGSLAREGTRVQAPWPNCRRTEHSSLTQRHFALQVLAARRQGRHPQAIWQKSGNGARKKKALSA
jgi:hypothetical protein